MPFSGYLSPYSRPLDPGTPEGAKAYQKCVHQDCPDDERLVVSVGTATAVRKQLIQDSNTFCFGAPVHAVPIKFKFVPDMSATGMGTPGGTERPPPPPYKMVVAEKGSILLNSTVPEANVLLDMYRQRKACLMPKSNRSGRNLFNRLGTTREVIFGMLLRYLYGYDRIWPCSRQPQYYLLSQRQSGRL